MAEHNSKDCKHKKQVCQVFHTAMEIIGKRWTGAIITTLFDGPSRFNEFHSAIPDISSRLLTERLKELEEYGLVTREVLNDRPIQVIYTLTEKGKELRPILNMIGEWAGRWSPHHINIEEKVHN